MKEDQNFGTSNFNNLAQKMDYIFGINKYQMHFSKKGTKGARFLASEMCKIGIFWRSKKSFESKFPKFKNLVYRNSQTNSTQPCPAVSLQSLIQDQRLIKNHLRNGIYFVSNFPSLECKNIAPQGNLHETMEE